MDKPKHFKLVGNYPKITELKKNVLSFDDIQWNRFKYKQKTVVGHKDTRTIPLIYDYMKKTRKITHPNYVLLEENLKDISKWLHSVGYPQEIKRANLVKLLSNSQISAHIDKGEFLQSTNRVHFVVRTNPFCYFKVGDEIQAFGEGEVWELNNTGEIHSVHNDGDTDRIHLIVDMG